MRFTIRYLLWLMVVAGLALGWLHEYRKGRSNRLAARQLVALVKALESRRYVVSLGSTYVTFGPTGMNPSWNATEELPAP